MASILNEDKVKHIEKEFDKVFYSLVDDLVCHLPPDTLDSKKWFKRVSIKEFDIFTLYC